MSIKKKLKYVLDTKDIKMSDYAVHLDRSKQSVSRKFSTNAFTIQDLIDIADLTGYQLGFIDENGKVVISFETDDIEK